VAWRKNIYPVPYIKLFRVTCFGLQKIEMNPAGNKALVDYFTIVK